MRFPSIASQSVTRLWGCTEFMGPSGVETSHKKGEAQGLPLLMKRVDAIFVRF